MPVRYTNKIGKQICTFIADYSNITAAAKAIGCGETQIWAWARIAAADKKNGRDSKYMVRGWPDAGDEMFLSDAIAAARRVFTLSADLKMRQQIIEGTRRAVLDKDGNPAFELDLAALAEYGGFTEEARKLAAIDQVFDYPYRHQMNAEGKPERIPVYVMDPVPATLKIAGMRAMVPGIWNVPERREVDTSINATVRQITREEPKLITEVPRQTTQEDRLARLRSNPNPAIQDMLRQAEELKKRGPSNPRPELNGRAALERAAGREDPEDTVYNPQSAPPQPPQRQRTPMDGDGVERTGSGAPMQGGFKVR